MRTSVFFTRRFRKGYDKLPEHLKDKVDLWVLTVERCGLETVQAIPGYRDEALKGERKSQRSFRLNQQWRVLYTMTKQNTLEVTLLEATPHDYRTR